MTIKKKYLILISVVVAVVFLDLLTKWIFSDIKFKEIIPYLINFETNNGNYGAAFGIFNGKKWFLITISTIFVVAMIIVDVCLKIKSKTYTIGFAFMLGGAIGNLFDRIGLGYVRDFIQFDFWPTFPTFNLADSFLCVGVGLICVYLLFFSGKEKSKDKK
ncbi:MAG: signal peptidase II [Clostridia bacterium]|nr:signal peptidase II [Clostridia bacterium]